MKLGGGWATWSGGGARAEVVPRGGGEALADRKADISCFNFFRSAMLRELGAEIRGLCHETESDFDEGLREGWAVKRVLDGSWLMAGRRCKPMGCGQPGTTRARVLHIPVAVEPRVDFRHEFLELGLGYELLRSDVGGGRGGRHGAKLRRQKARSGQCCMRCR